jgi:hypothetical protein
VSQANFCIPPLARPDLDASAPNEETSAAGRIGLFHHLIGGGEDRLWDRQAEQPGGLLVNHEFKLPGLLDRQIDWLCALDDLSGIHCSLAPNCSSARTVAHQPATFGELAPSVDRRYGIASRQELSPNFGDGLKIRRRLEARQKCR